MTTPIETSCEHCGSEVISTKEWLEENRMLFCNSCCKSFTPKTAIVISQTAVENVDEYLGRMDYYPGTHETYSADDEYGFDSTTEEDDEF